MFTYCAQVITKHLQSRDDDIDHISRPIHMVMEGNNTAWMRAADNPVSYGGCVGAFPIANADRPNDEIIAILPQKVFCFRADFTPRWPHQVRIYTEMSLESLISPLHICQRKFSAVLFETIV